MSKSYRSSQEIMLRYDRKSGRSLVFGALNLAAAVVLLTYVTVDNAAETAGAATKRALLRGARLAGRGAALVAKRR